MATSMFLYISYLVLFILSLVSAGNIKFLDFFHDYGNENLMTQLYFVFSLDTSLPVGGYLRFSLPFKQSPLPTAFLL